MNCYYRGHFKFQVKNKTLHDECFDFSKMHYCVGKISDIEVA